VNPQKEICMNPDESQSSLDMFQADITGEIAHNDKDEDNDEKDDEEK
jgi:hypothetical protein